MKVWGVLAAIAAAVAAPVAAAPFDPAPWLADLVQARQAFHEKYANWDWAENERGVKIDPLFDDLAQRLRKAADEDSARTIFDRLQRKLGDGHVEIEWPDPPPPSGPTAGTSTPVPDLCAKLGYDARQNGPGTAQALAGYEPLPGDDTPFDAGTVAAGSEKIGIIRIGVFQPQGFPDLCRQAVRKLGIPADKPCSDECQDRIVTAAYVDLTNSLEDRIRELKSAGATVLLVDITRNGGGSEWAEAAARTFTPKLLVSERRGFVRGEHWARQWRDLAAELRGYAEKRSASRTDRQMLLDYAAQADAAAREAETPCPRASSACSPVAAVGYSTGLLGSARSGPELHMKGWKRLIFSPAQYSYHDGVWDGPLLVLVDQETWSAAEEFAALLQDNKAAVVIGARTGGAGCGYTNGGDPTKLKNSGAVLKLPDCVRFRADGSNEVRGILPDVPLAIRAGDSAHFSARLIAEKLPSAVAAAKALQAQSR
jgi:hypothetical protein